MTKSKPSFASSSGVRRIAAAAFAIAVTVSSAAMGQAQEPLKLDPARTAILVIDVQKDNLHPDGVNRNSGSVQHAEQQNLVSRIGTITGAARTAGSPVIHNWFVVSPQGREMRDNVPMFAGLMQAGVRRGTWGAEPMDGAEPQTGDHVIERFRMSPFNGTQLDILLRSLNVDTIVLTGAFTNFAVEHAARDGADAGYRIVLVGDATSTMSAEWQRATTDYAMKMLGTVTTTGELIRALQRS